MRGESLLFHTGLCLLNSKTGDEQVDCIEYRVHFRRYSNEEIERYLQLEQPYNCAASFKSEQLGISLVERMEGADPSALIGLPLIRLAAMLRQEGMLIP
jgi:7-methyl-GTP pyrophosphatase